MVEEKTCSVDGCRETVIKAKGMCEKHYARQRRNGTIKLKNIERHSISTCLALECDKPHKTKGYCSTHAKIFRDFGTPYRPKIIKQCGVESCHNPHQAKGLCKFHYNQWITTLGQYHLLEQLETTSKWDDEQLAENPIT